MCKKKIFKTVLITSFTLIIIFTIAMCTKLTTDNNNIKKYQNGLAKHDYSQIEYLLKHGLNPETLLEDYQDTDFWAILKFKLTGQNENQLSHRNFEERYTGVFYGCKWNDVRMAKLLLDFGASANPKVSPTGESPLGMAAFYDNYQLCELLLKHGANPKSSTQGRSAIMLARSFSDRKLIILLEKYGAKD